MSTANASLNLYWLSYCTEARPYGVCVVNAGSFEEALQKAQQMGLAPQLPHDDPTAEIAGVVIPRGYYKEDVFMPVSLLQAMGEMTVGEFVDGGSDPKVQQ